MPAARHHTPAYRFLVPWNLVSACGMNLTIISGLGDARTFILADLAAAGAAAIAAAAAASAAAYLLM